MDSTDKLWAVFWVAVAFFLSVVLTGMVISGVHRSDNNTERDKFYARYCKIISETNNSDSVTTRTFKCVKEN